MVFVTIYGWLVGLIVLFLVGLGLAYLSTPFSLYSAVEGMNQTEIMDFVHGVIPLSNGTSYSCFNPIDYITLQKPTQCSGYSESLTFILRLRGIPAEVFSNSDSIEGHSYVVTEKCILDPLANYYICGGHRGFAGAHSQLDPTLNQLLTREGERVSLTVVPLPICLEYNSAIRHYLTDAMCVVGWGSEKWRNLVCE